MEDGKERLYMETEAGGKENEKDKTQWIQKKEMNWWDGYGKDV